MQAAARPSAIPPPEFLIDQILSSSEVSLISGPSGSGKTTLLLQILTDWAGSREVFGHASCPLPYALVSCDRPMRAINRTMTRLGITPESIPHFSIINPSGHVFRRTMSPEVSREEHTLSEILHACKKLVDGLALLAIDGFSNLCPGKIVDQREVSNFLRDAARLCEVESVAILGTVYAPKAREGEGYASPRDRMLGSGAWASHTGTKFIIEPKEEKRTLHILPQDAAPEEIQLMHDLTGRLVPYKPSGASAKMDEWLSGMAPGTLFTTGQAKLYGDLMGVSESTVEKWLRVQIALGTVFSIDRGEYRVTGATTQN